MERQPSPEYYSATPDEIRSELGLSEDASRGEVIRARWAKYEQSSSQEAEQTIEGDINAS